MTFYVRAHWDGGTTYVSSAINYEVVCGSELLTIGGGIWINHTTTIDYSDWGGGSGSSTYSANTLRTYMLTNQSLCEAVEFHVYNIDNTTFNTDQSITAVDNRIRFNYPSATTVLGSDYTLTILNENSGHNYYRQKIIRGWTT